MDVVQRQSPISQDHAFDRIDELALESSPSNVRQVSGPARSSIKSLISKKFHSTTGSTPMDTSTNTISQTLSQNEVKQKKRRTSFRQFSQFLKRSHSAHSNLSNVDTVRQRSQVTSNEHSPTVNVLDDETHRPEILHSNSNGPLPNVNSILKPISEEDHRRLTTTTNDNDLSKYAAVQRNTVHSSSKILFIVEYTN
jgi:hypothetical protein